MKNLSTKILRFLLIMVYLLVTTISYSQVLKSANELSSNNQKISKVNVPGQTIFGVLSTRTSLDTRLTAANNLLATYVRETQILKNWNGSQNTYIDFWLNHNKKVILNINNDTTPSPFPKNLTSFETKLRSILDVYGSRLELVVIENEELNDYDSVTSVSTLYHFGSMQDYINELTLAANICVQKGVPVTNGGLTTPIVASLSHYYSVNGKQDSVVWLSQQMNGVSSDSTLWKRTDSLLLAYKTLPLSYVNLHWYEPLKGLTRMTGVLQVLCNYITQQTGKQVITNETGVKTTDSTFVTALMNQWDSANVKYCIFFDGSGSFGAKPLTSSTGVLVDNGIAFRNYNFGKVNACTQTLNITPAGTVKICQGKTSTFTASAGFANYLWNTGQTTRAITVNTANNYTVTSNLGNCIAFSNNTVVLEVNPLPAKPTITTSISPVDVCPSKSVKLTSSSAKKYLWNTGDTTKIITVTAPGNYKVTISDANGCSNTSAITVVTYKGCSPPVNLRVTGITGTKATFNWDSAACAVGYQYQYRPKGTGAWTIVQVTSGGITSKSAFGLSKSTTYEWKILTRCKVTPDTLASVYANGPDFTTLASLAAPYSISEDSKISNNFSAILFPTIVHENATLTLGSINKETQIILSDLSGRIFWQNSTITNTTIKIPVTNLTKGIYLLIVKDRENFKTLRFIKD